MESKEALKILAEIAKKYPLTDEEKEAITKAIGYFSWASLSKGVTRAQKEKRNKNLDW